jgi:hypothetical protein
MLDDRLGLANQNKQKGQYIGEMNSNNPMRVPPDRDIEVPDVTGDSAHARPIRKPIPAQRVAQPTIEFQPPVQTATVHDAAETD